MLGAFLLTPWLIGINYSKYITLRDTETVISNVTNNTNRHDLQQTVAS